MKSYLEKHHRILGSIGAVAAGIIAAIYLVVTPEGIPNTGLFRSAILAYGHSLCWLLLCVASILWALESKNRWSVPFAYSALAVYVIFMSTLLLNELM